MTATCNDQQQFKLTLAKKEPSTNDSTVGSMHIDTLTIAASDLAQRGVMAVYPVGGWWKENRKVDPERCVARFSLVFEIDGTEAEVDLYVEVQQKVALQTAIGV